MPRGGHTRTAFEKTGDQRNATRAMITRHTELRYLSLSWDGLVTEQGPHHLLGRAPVLHPGTVAAVQEP